jgi:von Willebrand factor type A domain
MIRELFTVLIVLLTIFIAGTVDAQTKPALSGSALNIIASSENDVIKILGIDSTAFPKIKVTIFVNKLCAQSGKLKKENLNIMEDGNNVTIDNFYFARTSSGRMLDLAIVFDDTGSMGDKISAMQSKIDDMTNSIKTAGIDARYSLVSFKDNVSVKTKWTNDTIAFKKQVNTLHAEGGGDEPEDSLDAIESVLSMGFRSNAQKVILIITDAHAHYKDDGSRSSKYTKEDVIKDLKDSGAIFIPVTPTFFESSKYVNLREIANEIHSMWIDMNSADFSTILDQFKEIITGSYVIEYTSYE